MAVLNKLIVATTLLSSLALAAPLKPRDYFTDIVTEIEWTTLDVTTTAYVDDAASTTPVEHSTSAPARITTSAMTMEFHTTSSAAAKQTATPSAASKPEPTTVEPTSTPSSTKGGEFYSSVIASSATSAVPTVAPTPATTAPTTTAAPAVSSSAAAVVASPSTATAAAVSSAVPNSNSRSSGGSITASCQGSGNSCLGAVTHWDGGLSACGKNVDTQNDLAIALPFEFMGTLSNSNPLCDKSVTLRNPKSGTTVQAFIKDKCMGCVNRDIDCTNKLFNAITDGKGDGRFAGIEWWIN